MILRTISHKRVAAAEFISSRVSKAVLSRMCVLRTCPNNSLRYAASSAAERAICDAETEYEAADALFYYF